MAQADIINKVSKNAILNNFVFRKPYLYIDQIIIVWPQPFILIKIFKFAETIRENTWKYSFRIISKL